MSVLEKLNAKTLELRKARDPLAPLFQQIQAGAAAAAKDRGLTEPVTEADAISALKKALKNANDMLKSLNDRIGGEVAFDDGHPLFKQFELSTTEVESITALLPAAASAEDVKLAIDEFLEGKEASKKLIGQAMGHLRAKFGDTLDNGLASKLVQEALS